MPNYISNKIYVQKRRGRFEFSEMESKIGKLQERNNIPQNIITYYTKELDKIEIRYGARCYPVEIDILFPRIEYEIWNITSDEGGARDVIWNYPLNSNLDEFCDSAYYKFNKIRITGNPNLILNNLAEIFGENIQKAESKIVDDAVEVKVECIYTSNNYFTNEYDRKIIFELIDNIPVSGFFGQETELWDLDWNLENIEFGERFYHEVLNEPDGPNGKTKFPYIKSVEFLLEDKVTNLFEWNSGLLCSNWEHTAMNDFTNIVNDIFRKTVN